MLTPDTPIATSAEQGCAQMFHPYGPQWQRGVPDRHELAIRNDHEEIYLVFKLWLAPQSVPWCASARRLIVTHAGVPHPFRRRGILSSTMDALIEIFGPDEVSPPIRPRTSFPSRPATASASPPIRPRTSLPSRPATASASPPIRPRTSLPSRPATASASPLIEPLLPP